MILTFGKYYFSFIFFNKIDITYQVFMKEKAVQFVYDPLAITQLFNDNQAYTVDKTAWQQQLDKLINDAGYRQTYSQEIFERNHSAYTPEAWKNYLEEIRSFCFVRRMMFCANPLASDEIQYRFTLSSVFRVLGWLPWF